MVSAVVQADERQGLVWTHWLVRDLSYQRDVLISGEARDQIVELEDEPDMLPAIGGERAVIEPGQFEVLEEDAAAGRLIEAADDVQERRFSAARWAEQHDHLAGPNIEIETVQRMNFDLAGNVGLGERPCCEHLFGHVRRA